MNYIPNKPVKTQIEPEKVIVLNQPASRIQPPEKKPLTQGQKVADKMAARVGSWVFLIGQSTMLVGWITFNSIPGLPHFDQQPFILLNLMFSFASAYTAPVVLMSQNRQSEEDRESANHNYQVTLQAAQQLELLHEKLDAEYSKKLDTLTTLIQQQQTANEVKVVYVPTQTAHEFDHQSQAIAHTPHFTSHPHNTVFVNVSGESAIASSLNLDDVQVVVRH
jgi:uncharacterized membrane protein